MRLEFLDSGPLGLLTNPRGRSKPDQCRPWVKDLAAPAARRACAHCRHAKAAGCARGWVNSPRVPVSRTISLMSQTAAGRTTGLHRRRA